METIVLSEVTQIKNDKHLMVSHICEFSFKSSDICVSFGISIGVRKLGRGHGARDLRGRELEWSCYKELKENSGIERVKLGWRITGQRKELAGRENNTKDLSKSSVETVLVTYIFLW